MDSDCSWSYIRGHGEMNVPFKTLPDMISHHAKTKDIAHIYIDWKTKERQTLTFSELYDDAIKFAKGLVQLGVQRGDIVTLGTEACPEWMIASIGTLMCGATTLLFNFKLKDGSDLMDVLRKTDDKCKAVIFPPDQNDTNASILQNICKHGNKKGQAKCAVLPNLKMLIAMTNEQQHSYLTLRDVMQMGQSEIQLPTIEPEDDAAIMMTSGSTGTPKLISHTHYALLLAGYSFEVMNGKGNKKSYNDRPFSWIGGYPCWEIFTGGTRVLIKHLSSIPSVAEYNTIMKNILQEEGCESCFAIPTTLHEMVNDETKTWNFKSIVSGGQPTPASLIHKICEVCDRFSLCYGCSEIGVMTFKTFTKNKIHLDYEAGIPFPGIEIKVVDTNGRMVKREERGEVLIRSVITFAGYIGSDIKQSQVLTKHGWFRTNDSGWITLDGCLIVEGRISDSLVKIGTRFQPVASIESKLKQNASIQDAVVITCTDSNSFQVVCCAVILKPGCQLTVSEMEDFLLDSNNTTANLLQQMQIPKQYLFFDQFPKTYNGKINRKEVVNICNARLIENKTN